MNRKKRKISIVTILLFVIGIVMYLGGLFLLFGSGISKTSLSNIFFSNIVLTSSILNKMKIIGAILFLLGFILFMIAVIFLYKNDNTVNLIIEGKADVITLIVMTYVLIFMIVICLLYNELIGALLFGITIIIQSVVNTILIRYYSKSYKRK